MAIKFFAFFFSGNQYFRMFLVSMADIIGSYERLPNDAVRAVAVAKRREYMCIYIYMLKIFLKKTTTCAYAETTPDGRVVAF